MTAKLRLGLLASHGGTNLQAILDACACATLQAEPRVVLSNNSSSGALLRARGAGIPAFHLSRWTDPQPGRLDQKICATLTAYGVEVVCMCGYMKRLGPQILDAFDGRILNIHPALLPKFGGKGYYGDVVHEAVLAAGESESGATVHLVGAEYDTGPILSQRSVPVHEDDTSETLAARVLKVEHQLYAETLQQIASGRIKLDGLDR